MRQGFHSLHFYSIEYWNSSPSNKAGERNGRIKIGKEEVKLSLKDSKISTKKLLDLINTFG
jgi:hypothetical protein